MSKILIAGDLLPSEGNYSLFEQGDARALFGNEICNMFAEADYSIFNLEGPLTDSDKMLFKDGPGIKAPSQTVNGIKNLGVKAVALANNHTTDFLKKGYEDTVSILEKAGIDYVGAGIDQDSIKTHISVEVGGKKVCIYNVSELFFNKAGKDSPGANIYDEYIVCNEIKELKKSHDFLIVIYHGGAEYFPYTTPQTRTRFHRMADCGADFITAQHTHCISCAEKYNGSYLLYGQGNFLFARQKKFPNLTKHGLIAEIQLTDSGFEVKNHLINIVGNVLEYDKNQDLSEFYERGKKLCDEDFLVSLFEERKSKEIMFNYLTTYKGRYPFRIVFRSLFPKLYHKWMLRSYSDAHCIRNFNVIMGGRRSEDMFYVWRHILKKRNLI